GGQTGSRGGGGGAVVPHDDLAGEPGARQHLVHSPEQEGESLPVVVERYQDDERRRLRIPVEPAIARDTGRRPTHSVWPWLAHRISFRPGCPATGRPWMCSPRR